MKYRNSNTIYKHIVLFVTAGFFMFPFLWMFCSSFKSEREVFAKDLLIFPEKWLISNYTEALRVAPIGEFFLNSVIAACIVVVFQVITCTLAAYGFAKLQFKGRKFLFAVLLFAMMVPEEATIIPNYLLAQKLGVTNTNFGIAMIMLTSVFGIFLLRQTIIKIPDELLQAAELDGCGELEKFVYIVLPNIKSAIGTVAILGFLQSWNSYMWPYLITDQTSARTIQIGLRYLIVPDLGPQWPMIMALSVMVLCPVLILFLFLQKYFVEGLTNSGLK